MDPNDDSLNVGNGEELVTRLHRQLIAAELAEQPAPRIDKFIIKGKLGAGAMGAVFRAHDPELGRDVALKFIADTYSADPLFQRRLRTEAQTLARLDAPQVVAVYEFGDYAGHTYMVMKLHEGETLATWTLRIADWRAIVDAYLQAGEGLAAAHRSGCIHRDFKADNAVIDRDGVVKVIDFGLARDLGASTPPEHGSAGLSTGSTGAHVAPELQEGGRADARSDQYAFCLALHEALGQLRWRHPRGRIRVPVGVRRALLRGLAADPTRRWPTMEALLADLRATRRGRSYAWLAGSLAFVTGSALVALFMQPPPALSISTHGPVLTDQRLIGHIHSAAEPQRSRIAARLVRQIQGLAEPTVLAAVQYSERVPGAIFRHSSAIESGVITPDGATVFTSTGGMLFRWQADGHGDPIVLREYGVSSLGLSHDGTRVAGATPENTVTIWRADWSGNPVVLSGHRESISRFVFTNDDQHILTVSSDGTAQVWNVNTGQPLSTLMSPAGSREADLLMTNTKVLTYGLDERAVLWKFQGAQAEPERNFFTGETQWFKLAPDDTYFAGVSSRGGGPRIWSLTPGFVAMAPRDADLGDAVALAISPADATLAASYNDGAIRLWTAGQWDEPPRLYDGVTGTTLDLQFSPDGRYLAKSGRDEAVRVWSLDADDLAFTVVHGETGESAERVHFSGDSRTLLTVGGKTAQTWAVDGWIATRKVASQQNGAVFSRDGGRVATWASSEPIIRIRSTDSLNAPVELVLPITEEASAPFIHNEVRSVQFSPDDEEVMAATDRGVWVMPADGSGAPEVLLPWYRSYEDATYSPDGMYIATLQHEFWQLYSAVDRKRLEQIELPVGSRGKLRFDTSGRQVLVVDGDVRLFSIGGYQSTLVDGSEERVTVARFSPDGQRLLIGAGDSASLHDLDGRTLVTLRGYTGAIEDAAFSPHGDRIATASRGGTVTVWGAGGEVLANLRGHDGSVRSVQFSPDGVYVLTGGDDGTARVWETGGSTPPFVLRGRQGGMASADFSPDGEIVLTRTTDGTVQLWRWNPGTIRELLAARSSDCLTPPERSRYQQLSEWAALTAWWVCERGHRRSGVWRSETATVPPEPAPKKRGGPPAVGPRDPYESLKYLAELVHQIRCFPVAEHGHRRNPGCVGHRRPSDQEWSFAMRTGTALELIIGESSAAPATPRVAGRPPSLPPRPAVLPSAPSGRAPRRPGSRQAVRARRRRAILGSGVLLVAMAGCHPGEVGDVLETRAPEDQVSARRVDDPVLGPGAVDCTTLGDAAPMCFIGVPSGSFMMGSEEEERALFHVFIPGFESRLNDEILHRVKLGAFELAATEVTDAQFKVVMGESLCHLSMYGCTAEEPTTIVFWDSAMEYLNKLTERENQRLGLMRTTCYEKRGEEWTWDKACTGYRLPTEAEWEYAARAGSHMHFSFGDYSRVLFDHAWLKYNSDDRAHPVGLKKPNAWGFFDMHGNVLEWVWDPYAPYDLMRTTNPTGPDSGKKRGCRGGTYISDPVELRSAARRWCDVGSSQSIMGFRVARGPLREPAP